MYDLQEISQTRDLEQKKILQKNLKDDNTPDTLKEINMDIKPGTFVAIIGKVGSGKTTLLKSILKMVFKKSGSAKKNGVIGYIS